MKTISLIPKQDALKSYPIEAEVITPDFFANKSLKEIGTLSVWQGNRKLPLSSLVSLSCDDSHLGSINTFQINMKGDFSKFKHVGEKMTGGKIIINGDIGMHLGVEMTGGQIHVEGSVDDFAGANISGGEIIIKGQAGHYLGGSLRGDWQGMKGGHIKIVGNVGNECGIWMRNGFIEITGDVSSFLGMHLHDGTIIVNGDVKDRAGASMTGGQIIINGTLGSILPSFEFKQKLSKITIKNYGELLGPFLEFKGDFAEKKQGTLYLLAEKNANFK
ncbi:MAG: formylmethanofuran dehydrogenase subunit C [Asgard group archaeon]|nr:formylmethanofuran dehydrogenase subunit C [Asgard group archaeon]